MASPHLLFNKQHLRRNRVRSAALFAQHSILADSAAESMLERLSFITRRFERVLEINSRTPQLSDALAGADPARSIIRNPQHCVFDDEFLPFADGSFDLILSPLSLHWANDVPGALIQARRALKPDGFFLAMLLGGDTLHELRAALTEAEIELRGGVSPRVAPFMDMRDGAALLQRAGFALPVADRERYTFTYPDIFALMHDLRGMGETHIGLHKDSRFTPKNLFARAGAIYRQRFAAGDGVRASFEMIALSGWAPHASQQQPLAPGAATRSLAEALATVEIKTADPATPRATPGARG